MKLLEHFWQSNRDWWHWEEGVQILNFDAPKEAQESYKKYLEQVKKSEKVI